MACRSNIKVLFEQKFLSKINLPNCRKSNSLSPVSNNLTAWSYVNGASEKALLGATIGHMMQLAANQHPDKEAFVFPHQQQRFTFEDLLIKSDELAGGLSRLGASRGDRIGIWAPNCSQWILAQYATARAGFILVNINPGYKSNELLYCLKKVKVKILIMAEKYKTQDYYDILLQLIPNLDTFGPVIQCAELPDLTNIVVIGHNNLKGTIRFCDVVSQASNADINHIKQNQNKLQFDDPINIQFTSGTTGFPKGATLTHHNILNNARSVGYRLNYHKNEARICLPLPMYHCFGMVMGSLQVLVHGATCVLPCATFDAHAAIKAVQEHKCNSLYGTPTMFIDYLKVVERNKFDVSSLKTGIMSGASCPIELLKKVVSQLNMTDISVCYGTTENSPVTFQSLPNDSPEIRVSTVGKIQDHFEAKIVDEEGNIVPVGVSGEIYVRGYGVMQGYWADEKATADSTGAARWFKTGDIGVLNSEGYCCIVGRKKDLIIRGGENIYPAEIEQLLHQHDNIIDAQVVGVPDARLGEEIAVWVKLDDKEKTNADDIRNFCKKNLAFFKVPKYVHFVQEFPMTVTGKVQKFKIRQESLNIFNLQQP